jgi:DNA repair exonuclease SbcCD ATPase subunit
MQALYYVIPGYAVQLPSLLAPLIAGVLFYTLYCIMQIPKALAAAQFADNFFKLKDSLVSQIDFDHRQSLTPKQRQFRQLQLAQTKTLCSQQDVKTIPIKFPKKTFSFATCLLLTTLFLCSFDASPEIKKQEAQNKIILKATESNKKNIEETISKLEEKMSEKEKEMLNSSQIKELLKGLKATKSKLDALRQYAQLEKEIGKINEKMKLRQDEKLLDEIGRELEKQRSTSKMGKMLTNKDYKKAADELEEEMKKHKEAFKKFKKKDERSLQRLQKLMDEMKKMANKMKNASDNLQSNYSSMRQDISNMSDAANELSEKLKEINITGIIKESDLQEGMKEADEANGDLENAVLVLSDKLKDTDTKKKFRAKLNALQQALANCQSCVNGNQNGPGGGVGSGIGSGSVDSTNSEVTSLEPGFDTQLKGTKGKGPSLTQVEQAQTGSGVARSTATANKSIEYKRQMESFIQQENVPEIMKNGVKEYFKRIHEE